MEVFIKYSLQLLQDKQINLTGKVNNKCNAEADIEVNHLSCYQARPSVLISVELIVISRFELINNSSSNRIVISQWRPSERGEQESY